MVSFTPRPLSPRERDPVTHWMRVWVGPKAGLDALAKRKNNPFLALAGNRSPVFQPVA